MVRLSDLPEPVANFYQNMAMPEFGPTPWAAPPDVQGARIAIVSTAGLHRRDDTPFGPGDSSYRIITGDVDYADVIMRHQSVNFDRGAFQQDLNVAFPLEHLRTLAASGEIGSVAQWHYSFMGATDPTRYEETGAQVSKLLKDDGVDAALLIPI